VLTQALLFNITCSAGADASHPGEQAMLDPWAACSEGHMGCMLKGLYGLHPLASFGGYSYVT